MSNFTFTLEEHEKNTKVIVLSNKELVEDIFDSYDFDLLPLDEKTYLIEDTIENIYEELTDFITEESEEFESSDSFLLTESDTVYEIESITSVNFLEEGTAKRKIVVRQGKKKIIFKCGAGQKKVGRRCVRRPSSDLMKMKRRARISARKAKRKRGASNRRRAISLRRRSVLVRNTPQKKKKK